MPVFPTAEERAKSLLWAGCSDKVTIKDGGRYVIPFGRWHPNSRADLLEVMADGKDGNGKPNYAKGLKEWLEMTTKQFRRTHVVNQLVIRARGFTYK
ncbi:short-chain dehydrogenase [Penicillium angulare]|uniref:short-chain dehydrogenase n=1 Tax=Penicillium angulare TaxID=116970 RepID=UPI0025423BE9|nr:short-chain dehydrogenase [Penicillium angulare]KAJ5280047.1 short-chain dehydrogenase [Penicillium angulare]